MSYVWRSRPCRPEQLCPGTRPQRRRAAAGGHTPETTPQPPTPGSVHTGGQPPRPMAPATIQGLCAHRRPARDLVYVGDVHGASWTVGVSRAGRACCMSAQRQAQRGHHSLREGLEARSVWDPGTLVTAGGCEGVRPAQWQERGTACLCAPGPGHGCPRQCCWYQSNQEITPISSKGRMQKPIVTCLHMDYHPATIMNELQPEPQSDDSP